MRVMDPFAVETGRPPKTHRLQPDPASRPQVTFPNTGPAVFSVTSSCATLTTVGEQAWDWSQHVVDHVEVHAADFDASVRFYATVLAPLGIPSWSEDSESERLMCFTRVNIVDRQPQTTGLHLCFVAASREQVDAFHRAGVEAGFRSNGAPGYRPYAPGYYAAFLLDPDDNNIEALYRDVGNPGHVS
jgi:catechol 2,3-dioxygenase-like lactoylglutathione lyase family enzyme